MDYSKVTNIRLLYYAVKRGSVFDGLVVELKSQMTTDESRAWVSAL